MKQLLQSMRDGTTEVVDVPAPMVHRGQLLIQTTVSLVSAGTERMLVEFGKGGWVSKARQQPDKVRMVMDKARTDGIVTTYEAVRAKLDEPAALGYCNVGRIIEPGTGAEGWDLGQRVVSNGKHAGIVCVPVNLAARIPDGVPDEHAAFTVIGAIGLQGIRLIQPTLGERIVVTGLGLIGLLTVQMLRANGCRVLGIDPDPDRRALAERFGATVVPPGDGVLAAAQAFTNGIGVDAVIVTASTKSSAPISQAANMCRQRGRIVLVGVTGLELNRADFYEKELTFQVSCSYGPGRYDPAYEEGGQDYPVGFVRWTEARNFEAVLGMMETGALNVEPLITHRFAIDDAADAMALLSSEEPSMGIVLDYDAGDLDPAPERRVTLAPDRSQSTPGARVSCVGAGNYASRILAPTFATAGADLRVLVSSGGTSAVTTGRKTGFAEAATEETAALGVDTDAVIVATRHDAHARQTLLALRAGKHVWCEKPLCLTEAELDEIEHEARARALQVLMVGFNRRFAPHIVKAKSLLSSLAQPVHMTLTVNAGAIPADHWTQDPYVGGGRIVGEACHFIDLLRHLAGVPVRRLHAVSMGAAPGVDDLGDVATLTLEFENGSLGVVNYLANGHSAFPKERLEIFGAGRVLQLDNFLRLTGYGWSGFSRNRLWRQDKGVHSAAEAFVNAIRKGAPSPIPLDEVIEVSRLSIQAARLMRGASESGDSKRQERTA